jgi:hypothetical protein
MGKKRNFTPDEDKEIVEVMSISNIAEQTEKLNILAEKLGREPRILRNRYFNYLNVDNSNFTEEEDKLLIELQKKYGNKWKTIEKYFVRRSSGQLATRFSLLIRRRISNEVKPVVVGDSPISVEFTDVDSYFKVEETDTEIDF